MFTVLIQIKWHCYVIGVNIWQINARVNAVGFVYCPSAASVIVQTTVPFGIWYYHFGYRLTRLIATDTAYVILVFIKKHRIITSYKCTEVLQGKTLCKLLRTKRLNKVKYKQHRYCEQYGNELSCYSQKTDT